MAVSRPPIRNIGIEDRQRAPSKGWNAMSPTSHAVGSLLRQTRPPRRLTAKLMKSGSPIWTVSCLSICQNEALSVDSVPAPMTRFGAMTSLSTYLGTAADAALAQDGRPRVSFAGRGVWTGIGVNRAWAERTNRQEFEIRKRPNSIASALM